MDHSAVLPQFELRVLQSGETLFAEGDPGDYAYIIESGEIEIVADVEGQKRVVNRIGAPALFGETSVLDQQPRSASAVAATDARLVAVPGAYVRDLLEHADPLLSALVGTLSGYLRSESDARRQGAVAVTNGASVPARGGVDQQLLESAAKTLRMQRDLQTALAEDELHLVYQPIRDLREAGYPVAGYEALLRWTKNGEPISPMVLIPVAEACPLIVPIGDFVVESSCHGLAALRAHAKRDVFVSLNVAPRQITDGDVAAALEQYAKAAGVSPSGIKLEITERAMLGGEKVGEWIAACQALGAQVALDDFGTGFSNLESLHRFRVDVLKIDGSFVRGLPDSERALAICRGVIELGKAFGMLVVAERVETEEQADLLAELGCTYAQGYFREGQPRRLEEHLAAD